SEGAGASGAARKDPHPLDPLPSQAATLDAEQQPVYAGEPPAEPEIPAPAADSPEARSDFRQRSLVIAAGWLATNLGLQIATLPLKFVLKDEVHLTAALLSSFFAIGNFTNYVKPLAGVM